LRIEYNDCSEIPTDECFLCRPVMLKTIFFAWKFATDIMWLKNVKEVSPDG